MRLGDMWRPDQVAARSYVVARRVFEVGGTQPERLGVSVQDLSARP